MQFRPMAAVATAAALLLLAPACGESTNGGSAKRELVEELEKQGMNEAQAECAADALIGAGFTRDDLEKARSGDVDVSEKQARTVAAAAVTCIGLDAPDGG